MIRTARNLEKSGVDFIVIPCNTAHYFLNDIQKAVNVPVLNMIEIASEYIKNNFPQIKNIGLLASNGTIKTEIYHNAFREKKISIIVPIE